VAQVTYNTTYDAPRGPWLVEKVVLLRLDDVFSNIADAFGQVAAHKRELEIKKEEDRKQAFTREALTEEDLAEIRERVKEDAVRRTVSVTLKGEKIVTDETVAKVTKHTEVTAGVVEKVELECTCGYLSIELTIAEDSYTDVRINGSPQDSDAVQRAYQELRAWVDENHPNWLLTGWARNRCFSILALIGIPFGVLFLRDVLNSPADVARKALASQAKALIDQGLTQANSAHALEVLLRSEFRIYPIVDLAPVPVSVIVGWCLLWACTFIVAAVVPKTTIGLGRNAGRLQYWKWWIRVVSAYIPGVYLARS
jgi:hypothetical protein